MNNYICNKYVNRVIAVSPHVKEVMENIGCKSDKISVVLNGICIEKHHEDYPKRIKIRSKFDIDKNENVVIVFGSAPEVKGVDIVINAIDESIKDTKFVFVGSEKMKKFIEDRVTNSNKMKNILVLETTDKIDEIFNMGDIFLSASRTEAFSYSIGEAMLYKLMVISSDIDGPNFYNQAQGVFTFKSEDINSLRNTIIEVNNLCKNKRKYLGDKNREFVESNLHIDTWCKSIVNIHNDLNR